MKRWKRPAPSQAACGGGWLDGCRQATDDFRHQRGISQALQEIDGAAVFWRKPLAT
jgi:hypothetical protein